MQPAGAGTRARAAWALLAVALLLPSGASAGGDPHLRVLHGEAGAGGEKLCAWFGDRAGDTLYFGEAAFWNAYRAHGRDPSADLDESGRQWIGRADLAHERLEPPLDVTQPGARTGVWDVLAHPNGRLYFTTFFEDSGWVDPLTGARRRLEAVGPGLSELALASGGQIVAARYGRPGQRDGSVVRFSADGFVIHEWPMVPSEEQRVAPKGVAYDRVREETWVLTDLLPDRSDAAIAHDTRVIDRWGHERLRIDRPEIQFAYFDPDGTGYLAERDGAALSLRILAPGDGADPLSRGRVVLLDAGFPAGFDFVQDLKVARDGRVVATRWSGQVHVVSPDGRVATVGLPRLDDDGLYYTGVLRGDRLCATWCSDVAVVCRDAPGARAAQAPH